MKYRVIAASILILMEPSSEYGLEHIEILNIRPNLLIVHSSYRILAESPVESAAMALLFGLTLDVLMGKTWAGMHYCFLVSIPISLINEKLYRDKILVLLTLTLGSSVL